MLPDRFCAFYENFIFKKLMLLSQNEAVEVKMQSKNKTSSEKQVYYTKALLWNFDITIALLLGHNKKKR